MKVLTQEQKAKLFDKIVDELKKPNNFHEMSSHSGYGYFMLRIYTPKKTDEPATAVAEQLGLPVVDKFY